MALVSKFNFFKSKKNYNFINCWRIFCIILFIYVIINLVYISNEIKFKAEIVSHNKIKVEFELNFCYELKIEDKICKSIQIVGERLNKSSFAENCNFVRLIGCYTKDLQNKSTKQIIEQFEKCNIQNLTTIDLQTNFKNVTKIDYQIYNNHICVNYKFEILDHNQFSKLKILNNQNNQNVHISTSIKRFYSDQSIYSSTRTNFFKRNCWSVNLDNKSNFECTETNKKLIFNFKYYSTKYLESNYVSNCKFYKDSNFKDINQDKCNEICLKQIEKYPYHTLTYSKNEDYILNFTEDNSKLDKCSRKCFKRSCLFIGLLINDFNIENIENHSEERSEIIIDINNKDFRTEAIPLFPFTKLLWMFFAFFSIFFGFNCYALLLFKSPNLFNSITIINKRKRKEKAKKNLKILGLITLIGLILSLILEWYLFNFGKVDNFSLLYENTMVESKVSVSICFDLCKIIKSEKLNGECTNELLRTKTIKELDDITWNSSDFKKVSSMRNSARIYPIRHKEFNISSFFREFKKCFLLFYDSKDNWPHLSVLRISKIYVNVTKVNYTYFYIENGFMYPKFDSKPTKKSIIHVLSVNDLRNNCTNYNEQNYSCKSKDDCIQKCIIKKSKDNGFPIQKVNLIINDEFSKYYNLKFYNNSKEIDECLKKYNLPVECNATHVDLTFKEIRNEGDDISISLNPTVKQSKSLEDEQKIIVFNRIISILIIFTGISIKEILNLLILIYSYKFYRFNFQLLKRIFYLLLFLLFLIYFIILFYQITHEIVATSHSRLLKKLSIPKIRICYQTNIDLTNNNITSNILDNTTLSLEKFLKKVIINKFEIRPINSTHIIIKHKDYIDDYLEFSSHNNLNIRINIFYFDGFKCFNFDVKRFKNIHLNINNLKNLNNLFKIVINTDKLPIKKLFVYLNTNFTYDFNLQLPLVMDYNNIYFTPIVNIYRDDFFLLKYFYLLIKNFLGLEKTIDNPLEYVDYLSESFQKEQFSSTTLTPLYPSFDKNLKIKNRQFNNFIYFRQLTTNKNKYDFTKNTRLISYLVNCYPEKNYYKDNTTILSFSSNSLELIEYHRNKYQYLEFLIHLLIAITFWLKINLFNLPYKLIILFSLIKFFIVYFLYYIVAFIILLFELWFKIVKFLKIKNN